MNIKLSPQTAEPSVSSSERVKAAFLLSFGGLLAVLRTVFLPHLLAAFGLFLFASYTLYKVCFRGLPAPLAWLVSLPAVGGYGLLALTYAAVTSAVFAMHSAACRVEDLLYELFASLKDKVRAQIENMDEGLAKTQAKVILENSLREAFAPLKALRFGGAPAALAGVFLSLLAFVARSVFLARLARLSGSAVNFSAVFAGRATLVGALFLNFRWLSALLLWALYALGALALAANLWLVW